MSERIHVYPLDIKKPNGRWTSSHCTNKTGLCGCKPKIKQGCPECAGLKEPDPLCWRCGGEGVVEPYNDNIGYLVIHNQYPTGMACYPDMPDKKLGAK